MKFERRKRHLSEVNAGALTDIMFFLLLFFLIISTLTNPNVIKLLLPQSAPTSEIAKNYVTVSINPEFQYFIDQTPVNPDDLETRILEATAAKSNNTVVLRVSIGVPIEYAVKVLDIGMRLRLKVVLETQRVAS